MDIHVDWQVCDSSVKISVSPARWIDFVLRGLKNTLEIYDFQLSHANIHPSMSFLFLKPQCQSAFGNATATDSNKANQGDIMTPCPAVSPRVPFCAHNGHKFPGPCIILLKNVITPLRTPLMTIRENVQHVHNGNKFRWPCKILVKNVITPPPPSPLDDLKRACATCWTKATCKSWTPIFANFIFQICNRSTGSYMAHLKICNPSKTGVSAACQKQQPQKRFAYFVTEGSLLCPAVCCTFLWSGLPMRCQH